MEQENKLRLNKETVRKLNEDQLKSVGGGLVVPSVVLCPIPTLVDCDCDGTSLPVPTYNCQ